MNAAASLDQAVRQPSVAEVAVMARSLYGTGAWLRRKMQSLRPYACPIEILLGVAPQSGSVLDVGCGSGLFLGLVVAMGKPVTAVGVDISESALELANQMRETSLTPEQRALVTFEHIRNTGGWPAKTFDMVSLIDVMHHVPRKQHAELFDALAAHVKPGGILLYKDMVRRPWWRALLNWLHDLTISREWIHYLPVEQVDQRAERAGFVRLRAETINRLWYGHELRVYRKRVAP